jgi:hypothetical protein
MSMLEERRGRLDHAIDRAVRDMVQVDPPPGLRQRVAHRLADADAPGVWPAALGFGRRSAILATAAAVVFVFAAFVWLREPTPRPEGGIVQSTPAASPDAAPPSAPPMSGSAPVAEPLPAAPAARVAGPTAPRIPPARDGIFGERNGRVRAANLAADRGDLLVDADLLIEPALPLVDGGIQPLEPITIEPIRLAPLAIRPVTLNAPSGGK